jgi:hypothetical protein
MIFVTQNTMKKSPKNATIVLEPILDPMRLDNLEPSLELILRGIGIAPNTPGIFGG